MEQDKSKGELANILKTYKEPQTPDEADVNVIEFSPGPVELTASEQAYFQQQQNEIEK